MSKKLRSNLLLLITVTVWGLTFIAQKEGAVMGNFTLNGIRTCISAIVLIPVIILMNKGKAKLFSEERKAENKLTLKGGIFCGIALFVAANLQQFGLSMTDVGKSGFLTALYVVFVPIISVIIGKKVKPIMWVCVAIGLIGCYLLSLYGMTELSINLGDLLLFFCAISFAIQIMFCDHFAPLVDPIKLAFVEFAVSGTLGVICMFIFEEPKIDMILDGWFIILWAGMISGGIGYTLQMVAQKHADPSEATLIMSLEAVIAAVAGAIVYKERMTGNQGIGCLLIFLAAVIPSIIEIASKGKKKDPIESK